ncbi:regulator of G-protein signaling 16-like [Pelobates fuscus]|uniref:regulator of G-protein signaling 16-like n=1 Tax=Pelobates fuscus TaxID=191477 RepID=UPI002FE492D8
MCREPADTNCSCPEWAKDLQLSIGTLIHKLEAGHNLLATSLYRKKANSRSSKKEAMRITDSFSQLLSSKDGLLAFSKFLKTEFSEENLEFWMACEEYRKIHSDNKLRTRAQTIYQEFLQSGAPREVNIDHHTREFTLQQMAIASKNCFDAAQEHTRVLMEKDSYPRFIKSPLYKELLHKPSVRKLKLSFR